MIQRLSRVQTIALGFLLIIAAGTVLLMLPIASKDGGSAGFLNAFFTATSSTCVTGLVVVDTYTGWSLFGQAVILLLIRIHYNRRVLFHLPQAAYWLEGAQPYPGEHEYAADWRRGTSGYKDCALYACF